VRLETADIWFFDSPSPLDTSLHSVSGRRNPFGYGLFCSIQFSLCMTGTLPGAIGVCRSFFIKKSPTYSMH
jgi:hypothetical protein